MPILHHVESFDFGNDVAACGSTIWQWATTGWSGVDCPGCLSAQHRVQPTGGYAPAKEDTHTLLMWPSIEPKPTPPTSG